MFHLEYWGGQVIVGIHELKAGNTSPQVIMKHLDNTWKVWHRNYIFENSNWKRRALKTVRVNNFHIICFISVQEFFLCWNICDKSLPFVHFLSAMWWHHMNTYVCFNITVILQIFLFPDWHCVPIKHELPPFYTL